METIEQIEKQEAKHIKLGKAGLIVVLSVLGLKVLLSFIAGGIISAITNGYLIPSIILFVMLLIHKKRLRISLIVGMVFGILDLIDDILVLPYVYQDGGFMGGFMISWMVFRLFGFGYIINAFRLSFKKGE